MSNRHFPAPTVGVLIFNPAGELLLVRSHKWHGKWTIPGGHIELWERMEDALVREAKEETGLDVTDPEFLLFQQIIYDDAFWKKRHFIFFNFACRTESIKVVLNHEAEEYRWVMPEKALTIEIERYLVRAIRRYLEKRSV